MTTAWHNNPELKEATLRDLRNDHQRDQLIRGTYGDLDPDNGAYRGCQVGCLVMADMARNGQLNPAGIRNTMWHAQVEERFGVPRALAYLWDRTFEGVPSGDAPAFAIASVEAVPVGADLSMVVSHRFQISRYAQAAESVAATDNTLYAATNDEERMEQVLIGTLVGNQLFAAFRILAQEAQR